MCIDLDNDQPNALYEFRFNQFYSFDAHAKGDNWTNTNHDAVWVLAQSSTDCFAVPQTYVTNWEFFELFNNKSDRNGKCNQRVRTMAFRQLKSWKILRVPHWDFMPSNQSSLNIYARRSLCGDRCMSHTAVYTRRRRRRWKSERRARDLRRAIWYRQLETDADSWCTRKLSESRSGRRSAKKPAEDVRAAACRSLLGWLVGLVGWVQQRVDGGTNEMKNRDEVFSWWSIFILFTNGPCRGAGPTVLMILTFHATCLSLTLRRWYVLELRMNGCRSRSQIE